MVGESILRGLRQRFPHLSYTGIGGPRMEEAGSFHSLVPLSSLSHMGLWAIIKNLPALSRIFYSTLVAIRQQKPVGLLTIDAPEFCLRLSRRISEIPRIHCVAPAVWAWRPRRALTMSRATDHVLSLFPFEAPYFSHMPYTFVGHPVLERPPGCAAAFWQIHGQERPLLCLLPGSREQEIRKFLPVFVQTLEQIQSKNPEVYGVIVSPSALEPLVRMLAPHVPILVGEQEKSHAFAAATLALAASGTVTLELALHGTPMVLGYRVPRLTAWMIRRLIHVSSVGLINIVAREPLVPECLQDRFTPEILCQEVRTLLHNPMLRQAQREKTTQALDSLRTYAPFSTFAAQTIGEILHLPY